MNIPEKFWNTVMALVAVLTVFVVIVAVKEIKAIGYVGANPNQSNTINVSGTGEAVAVPDIATFSFSVTETAKTVAEAQTAATTKINAAIAALRDAGIEDRDIKTQGYNINPHYEYQNAVCPARAPLSPDSTGVSTSVYYCPPGKSVLTGYDVSQTIGVKVRDLTKAGTIFTAIGALKVDNVNGLNFSVDKPEEVQAKARAEAIAEAEAQAKQLAKQLGVRLVRIVSFSENNGYPYYSKAYGMGGDSAVRLEAATAPAPQVPVGEQEVTSTVNITYEIK